jgi:predicted unusual protein kinase regulating ubiquinone biosynthesis (AarF/ABC1/UbiB family)
VLTLEDVEAIKIADRSGIEAAGIQCSDVAAKVFDVYLHQIFDEGFFHADPHPGNLFVMPLGSGAEDKPEPAFSIVFVDFGMVGRIPPEVGEQLRQVLLALATRDAHRIVLAAQHLGMLLPGADLNRVERAITRVLEQFWGMSVTELANVDYAEMQDLAVEFRDLLFEMPFQVPHDFVFLGRAVGMLSGLSTSLDPDFNPWLPIESYAEGLLEGGGRWSGVRQGLDLVGAALQPVLVLPGQLERFLRQANLGSLEVRVSPTSSLEKDLHRLAWAADRIFWGMVFAALLVAGTWLFESGMRLTGTLMWAGAALSLFRGLMLGRKR